MNYNFSVVIPRENTSAIKIEKCEALFGDANVLPMWVADMDFATPPFVIERLQNRLQHPILGYTLQDDDFNNAIVNWLEKRFSWKIERNWLSICPGIVAGLNHAVQAYTKPGDKVLIQTPVYHPFFYAVRQNGRTLVTNSLVLKDGKYSINFDDFEEKLGQGVKLFILCSPHNPVGRVWTKQELTRIAELCLKYKVLIVADEIHADLVFKPHMHTPMAKLSTEVAQNTITFGSASKTFNIAGLATAWVAISNPTLLKRYNLQAERNGTLHGNIFGFEATKAAYSSQGEEWLSQLIDYLYTNIVTVNKFLLSNLPKINLIDPEGTYLLWLDFREYGLSEEALKSKLVKEAKLGLNAGDIFGVEGNGFQRMNIACPNHTVVKALDQLNRAFQSLK
jgi:cysteine-S-conjugate beta-lyase